MDTSLGQLVLMEVYISSRAWRQDKTSMGCQGTCTSLIRLRAAFSSFRGILL